MHSTHESMRLRMTSSPIVLLVINDKPRIVLGNKHLLVLVKKLFVIANTNELRHFFFAEETKERFDNFSELVYIFVCNSNFYRQTAWFVGWLRFL